MSNCLNMFKKLGFSKKMKTSAVRERRSMAPSLPTASTLPARPSSVSTTDESDSVSGDSLEGIVDLLVNLPDKRIVTVSVEKRMPVMDLLVHIATAHKFSAGSHVLKIVNDTDNSFLTYKPSTPIGSLNASVVCVELKKTNSEISSKTSKSNMPFEKTFRLQVHLPKQQLLVLRVSPQIKLCDLHKKICENKGLDPLRYKLQHPRNEDFLLDLSLTLDDYHLTEINMAPCNNAGVSRENSYLSDFSSVVDQKDENSKKATFPFLRQKAKSCASDSSDDRSSRGVSPVGSEGSCMNSSSPSRPISYPAGKVLKKRPAPPPPPVSKTQTRSERPPPPPPLRSKSTSSVKSCHSRHSSDSSGYHDSSVLGDSPELNELDTKLEANSRNLATSEASLVMPGMKKRRAPLPPGQKLFSETCEVKEETKPRTTVDSETTINDKRSLKSEPSSLSASPLPASKCKDSSASDPPSHVAGLEKQQQSQTYCDQNHNTLDVTSPTHKKISVSISDGSASSDSLTIDNESESKASSSSTIKEIQGSQEHLSEVDTQQVHALKDSLPPLPNIANANECGHASHLPFEMHQVPLEHVPSSSQSSALGTPNQTACGSVSSNSTSFTRAQNDSNDAPAKNNHDTNSLPSCSSLDVTEAEVHATEDSVKEDEFTECLQDALLDIDNIISDAEADMVSLSSHSSTVVMDNDVKPQEQIEQKKELLENIDHIDQCMPSERTNGEISMDNIQNKINSNVNCVVKHENMKSAAVCEQDYASSITSSSSTRRVSTSSSFVEDEDDDDGLAFEEEDKLETVVLRPHNRRPLTNFSIATYKSRATSNGSKLAKVESFNGSTDEKREINDHKLAPARSMSFNEHSNLTSTTESPVAKPMRNVILTVNSIVPKVTIKNNVDSKEVVGNEYTNNENEDVFPLQEHMKSMSMTDLEAIDDDGKLRKTQSDLFLKDGNGEDYMQMQHEYLELQKKLYFWQQQLLNNQTLLQRQHILPSDGFQLSAEMMSVPPNFNSEDCANDKASTFPKQNVKRNKDEMKPMSKGNSTSDNKIFHSKDEPTFHGTWNDVSDEKDETVQRDYQKNWKFSSVDRVSSQDHGARYGGFGSKLRSKSTIENGSTQLVKSSFSISSGERNSRDDSSRNGKIFPPVRSPVKFVERSAKDLGDSKLPESVAKDSLSNGSQVVQDKVPSDKMQPGNKGMVVAAKQGLSFKDIPLRFSLNGYNDVNRTSTSNGDPVPNERKFRRQRVAPKDVEEDRIGVKTTKSTPPTFLFGEVNSVSIRPERENGTHSSSSERPRLNETGTTNESTTVIKVRKAGSNTEALTDVTNSAGTATKHPVNKNISVVKIGSNTLPAQLRVVNSNVDSFSSAPRVVKSKPKIRPKSVSDENPRDALLLAIKNFGGKQSLRKVSESELS